MQFHLDAAGVGYLIPIDELALKIILFEALGLQIIPQISNIGVMPRINKVFWDVVHGRLAQLARDVTLR